MLALAAGLGGGAADLADAVPQPAGGAERGDGRELVGARAVAELELAEGLVDESPPSVRVRR